MMYYDRRLSPELLALLDPDGPLGWLVEWVRSEPIARIDFRREDGERPLGGVQVYMGRTSPLEVLGRSRGRVKLTAHDEYKKMTPAIFGSRPVADLGDLEHALRDHLDACRTRASSSFTEGEAVAHNGMMRSYGLNATHDDPLLAVDSEIVIGFRADDNYNNGTAHKRACTARLRAEVGLPARAQLPRKLDTIGVLPDGNVALVEVKDENGDILRAVHQAAVHVHRFRALATQAGYDLAANINGMIEQKVSVGLLPAGLSHRVRDDLRLVPVVAAPDGDADWKDRWWGKTRTFVEASPLLRGLRFWRLTPTGEVVEEYIPGERVP